MRGKVYGRGEEEITFRAKTIKSAWRKKKINHKAKSKKLKATTKLIEESK